MSVCCRLSLSKTTNADVTSNVFTSELSTQYIFFMNAETFYGLFHSLLTDLLYIHGGQVKKK